MSTQKLTRIAILAALAAILFLFPEIPTPIPFYKIDLSNLPVLLGAFSMGPGAGVLILFIKSLTGMLHTSSAYVGELADFASGLAMLLPAALIYRGKKTRGGALVGMLVGMVAASLVGVVMNYYVLIPFFISSSPYITLEAVVAAGAKLLPMVDTLWKFVLAITLPFNLIKFGLISLLTFLIYKPLSPLLHARHTREAA